MVTGQDKGKSIAAPIMSRPDVVSYEFSGFIEEYLQAVSKNWLLVAPDKHPEMLDYLATREQTPHPSLLPWSGEFYGKYLTGAVQVYRLTNDAQLRNYLKQFVDKLIALQAEDGYLGVYDKSDRLTCKVSQSKYNGICEQNWDLWGHYFGMMGLMSWYETTGDEKALEASRKIGDLLCQKFLNKPGEMASRPDFYTNLSPGHALCRLYRITGEKRYLDLARQIVDVEYDKAKDYYVANAISGGSYVGKSFYEKSFLRWETIHGLFAIADLYWITGEEHYKQKFEKLWWSIAESDRYNDGSFTSGEERRGNPYDGLTKETCCTIGWCAMSVEMLKLTGNSVVADELELSLVNAVAGYEPRQGDYCHYHTPMDGKRPPIKGLTCCTANAARGFGLLSDWALMKDQDGVVLNWYGPTQYKTLVKGVPVAIRVLSDYPRQGLIFIEVLPDQPVEFTLKLRIPHWSKQTRIVKATGGNWENVESGSYLPIKKRWVKGETVQLELDMGLHFWAGEKECEGRASVYYGPVLLALPRQNVQEYVMFDDKWKPYTGSTIDTYGSNQPGASFKYRFEGDEIFWTGSQSNEGGKAQVVIDGKKITEVDQVGEYGPFHCYSPVWAWRTAGLGKGPHEMEVTILDAKNEKSEGHWISVMELVTSAEDPVFNPHTMHPQLCKRSPEEKCIVKIEVQDAQGHKVILYDFDSAGEKMNPYISWLRMTQVPKVKFGRDNPLRSYFMQN